jgi:ankyrin repeat protein
MIAGCIQFLGLVQATGTKQSIPHIIKAAQSGDIEQLTQEISPESLSACDDKGLDALFHAIIYNHEECAFKLIDAGSDIHRVLTFTDPKGIEEPTHITTLDCAFQSKMDAVAEYIIKNTPKKDLHSRYIFDAIKADSLPCLSLLLNTDAYDLRTIDHNKTYGNKSFGLLATAYTYAKNNRYEMMKLLLEYGTHPEEKITQLDEDDISVEEPLLYKVAVEGAHNIVKLLVEHHADVNACKVTTYNDEYDEYGNPEHYKKHILTGVASIYSNFGADHKVDNKDVLSIVDTLCSAGSHTQRPRGEITPLEEAISSENIPLIKLLLHHGAQVDAQSISRALYNTSAYDIYTILLKQDVTLNNYVTDLQEIIRAFISNSDKLGNYIHDALKAFFKKTSYLCNTIKSNNNLVNLACMYGKHHIARTLIECGMYPDIKPEYIEPSYSECFNESFIDTCIIHGMNITDNIINACTEYKNIKPKLIKIRKYDNIMNKPDKNISVIMDKTQHATNTKEYEYKSLYIKRYIYSCARQGKSDLLLNAYKTYKQEYGLNNQKMFESYFLLSYNNRIKYADAIHARRILTHIASDMCQSDHHNNVPFSDITIHTT